MWSSNCIVLSSFGVAVGKSIIHLSIDLYFICVEFLMHPPPPRARWSQFLHWYLSILLRNKDGKSELDFDTDQYDILVSDFDAEEKEIGGVPSKLPETEYSLRVSENGPSAVTSTISYNVKISCKRIETQVCRDDALLGFLFTVYAEAVREYSYFCLRMVVNAL